MALVWCHGTEVRSWHAAGVGASTCHVETAVVVEFQLRGADWIQFVICAAISAGEIEQVGWVLFDAPHQGTDWMVEVQAMLFGSIFTAFLGHMLGLGHQHFHVAVGKS